MSSSGNTSTVNTGQVEKRMPHSIRFLELEWERIEAFAGERGLSPAEFVRFAALDAMTQSSGQLPGRLAALIEHTFRLVYFMASKTRDEMIEAGERKAVDELIAAGRLAQAQLLDGDSD